MHPPFPARNDHKIAWRVIDGQAVILSLEDKQIRGLNPVGTFIWELLDGKTSLDQIEQNVLEEFNVDLAEVREDIQEFIKSLMKNEMIYFKNPSKSQTKSFF